MLKKLIKKSLFSKIDLTSHYQYLKLRAKGNEKHIFIACLPKSGSTFLANVIAELTGFKFIQFQPIRGTNEHNIDQGVLFSNLNKNTVTQLHLKPSESNKKLLESHNIKVVYLYRGILDSLRSFHRHILNENDQWFMFTATEDFETFSLEKQFDFIIDLILPWYINFLTSWEKELKNGSLHVLPVDYYHFKTDNQQVIKEVLEFYDLNYTEEKINLALEQAYRKKDKLRFNDPKDNKTYHFNDEQMKKIKQIIGYYPQYSIKI